MSEGEGVPTTPEGKQLREIYARLDQKIINILDTTFKSQRNPFTVWDAIKNPKFQIKKGADKGRPEKELVDVVLEALKIGHLNRDQEMTLFRILEWTFTCVNCAQEKHPSKYEDRRKFVWGGPCADCRGDKLHAFYAKIEWKEDSYAF
ncbi:hypothetical protein V8C35DRAFT_308847 [Trichoderma chlorosporum]